MQVWIARYMDSESVRVMLSDGMMGIELFDMAIDGGLAVCATRDAAVVQMRAWALESENYMRDEDEGYELVDADIGLMPHNRRRRDGDATERFEVLDLRVAGESRQLGFGTVCPMEVQPPPVLEIEATHLRGNRYALRPKGQLGTCGFSPRAWTVQYVTARSPEEAVRKWREQ